MMDPAQQYVDWQTKKFQKQIRNRGLLIAGLLDALLVVSTGPLMFQSFGLVAALPLVTISIITVMGLLILTDITMLETMGFVRKLAYERVEAFSK